jgi:hypothetical protein
LTLCLAVSPRSFITILYVALRRPGFDHRRDSRSPLISISEKCLYSLRTGRLPGIQGLIWSHNIHTIHEHRKFYTPSALPTALRL